MPLNLSGRNCNAASWSTQLRGWSLRRFFLPIGDACLRHPMMRRLRELEQAQWWSRSALESERNRRLAQVVATSYQEVPFYRELFDRAGVKPAEIHSPKDLQKLPLVSKKMLKEAYPHRSCREVNGRTYETSTSGSTGENFRVREDHETAAWYRASILLSLEWAGWHIGEPHVQFGMTIQRNTERRLKDFLLGCHYISGYQLCDRALDECLSLMDRKCIRHLWGYPASLACLAQRARKRGWTQKLVTVVTWGDQLHSGLRQSIETAFGVRVCDTYGCGEGMQIAAQCGVGTHYHVHELDVVVEVVDDQGQPRESGQPGHIVVTRLHAGAMPFIRYQVGDVGSLGGRLDCGCRRSFKLMDSIQGRSGDYIVTPSGNRLIVHFFTGILEHFPEIASFQVVQDRVDSLILRIVPSQGFSGETQEKVVKTLYKSGADLNIGIELVDEIPLTPGGKRRFIIRAPGVG